MYLQIKRATLAALLCLCCFVGAFAQKTVSGNVKDAAGEPMIGVSVIVDGTSIGGVTDLDGNFTIPNVPDNATLKVSYVGYREQKISVAGKSSLNITMKEDNQNLDELVVIGYAVQKKRDLTGSVSSIKAGDLKDVAAPNAMQAMQAKVPGMNLTQASGETGGKLNINLRGARSLLASNDPLILVDGVEYGSTLDLNPSDIESMDILKDASSTAIYGTRGANGVIIITTKRGKAGKTNVSLNVYNSWNSATATPHAFYGDREVRFMQDKAEYPLNYKDYVQTGTWGTQTVTPETVLAGYALEDNTTAQSIYEDKSYTDWSDLIIRNSTSQNYEVGVNGGNDKTNFAVSLGLMKDRGLMKRDQMTRYNGKANIDHKISNYVKVGTSLLFTYKDWNRRNTGVYTQMLKMTSITHPYLYPGTDKESINYQPNPWYEPHCSPMLDEVPGAFQHNVESTRFFGNVYGELYPVKGMVFRSQFAVDRSDARDGMYQDYLSQGRYQAGQTSIIDLNKYHSTSFTWDNTLNYTTDFGGSKHNATFLLGHEMTQLVEEGTDIYGDAGKNHYYKSSFYDVSKINSPKLTPTYRKKSMVSFFGRVNYSYADKYLLTASLRADGASVLAKGHKWGYFPSVAAGWRIIEEDFMKGTASWLSNLKLRASWGISGNSDIEAYQTLAQLSPTTYYYYADGSSIPGKIPSSMANEDLTWEKTSSFDLGLDYGFLNGRINGTVDLYWSNTYDLLFYKTAPASSVFTSVISNVGKTKGFGVEVALNADIIRAKDFNWNANLSYTHFSDEVKELTEGVKRYPRDNTALIVGEPVHVFYDYKADNTWKIGEYKTYLENWKARHNGQEPSYAANYGDPGTPKIVDVNDDGTIDAEDRVIYKRDPDHIFGLTNTFSYKNFSLSVQMYARLGGYIQYQLSNNMNFETANWADVDYWTPTNQGAKFPNPGLTSAQQKWYTQYRSALQYEKADYFKVKDITLSYNLPKSLIKKAYISNCRVYGSLKNFFTISGIDNYDPERGGAVTFPLQKQVVLGINVEF
ncbi:MAG: TonB-dependent receptor [Prevotella buccae]|uniref:SusC/RagA family TonB-linked outer membrane protein n=1 Tax=Segatella buccae TaxID=28126 RepID=UPI0001C4107F|nr:TonB-dependent receptor [Segatella buccae]EFC76824.1 TonB-linked outer membrane protein, SusC/RagA family [Segatella buccae D17]MBS5894268.1 TonB-dependent receptor [Segatella buccae]